MKKKVIMPMLIRISSKTLVLYLALIFICHMIGVICPVKAEDGTLVSTEKTASETMGKKDPFKPFIETGSDVMKKAKSRSKLPLSPLQRQDLAVFNLVGISGNDKDGWKAIVEDAEKKFYPIVVGSLIGMDDGRVSKIMSDRVIVSVPSDDQKNKLNHITIMLHKDIEGAP